MVDFLWPVLWSGEKAEKLFDFTSFFIIMEVLLYTFLGSYNVICLSPKLVEIASKISKGLFKTTLVLGLALLPYRFESYTIVLS